MEQLIDFHLMRAAVYAGILCLEVHPLHGRFTRWLLPLAILLLALLSACESDKVRNLHLPVIEPTPVIYGWPAFAPMAELGTHRPEFAVAHPEDRQIFADVEMRA